MILEDKQTCCFMHLIERFIADNNNYLLPVKQYMNTVPNKVLLGYYDDEYIYLILVINFNCREESETIPLELSVFGSDLTMLGEPHWTKANHLKGSPLFVFYPGKPVFGIILMRE